MVSENFDIEFQSRFDELMKARRASVGEIRVHSNGVKYQKQPDGSWKPVKGQNVQFSPKKDDDYFGRNYFRYAGKPKEAIEFLLKNEKGQVRKAYIKDGLGEIDIVYGNNKKGLCHIEKRHLKNQNDFESREDMAQKIADALKYGKVEKDKKDVLIIYNEIRLIISQTVVYDDEDNFRNKHWILTSYNQNIPIKDKLRKAVSEETALEKSRFYPSSETPTFNRNGTERSLTVISSKDLSLPKGTTNMNDMQQFVDEIIEKSKKGAPIGTERTYNNGKTYIKTENGWKPKSGAKKDKKEDDQTDKTSSKVNGINSYASKASDEQLQAAIKDKNASPEVKQAAQEELNKRNPKEENNSNTGITDALQRLLAAQEKGEIDLGEEVLGKIKDKLESQKQKKSESLTEETLDKKLDKLKEDITSKIDEKLNELNGFKKITQTYVKQDGKTIVIKMKGDNQYKASSPGFKLESKSYESLVDFKKRIKEEFNKQFSKIEDKEENNIQDQEKDKKTILNFKDREEYKEYVLRRNSEKENLTKDQIDRFNKAFIEYENDIKDFPEKKLNEIKSYIENQNFNKILHVYSGFTPDSKMVLNRELINQGYLPIANGMLYSTYNKKNL